ncbi:hypothetical protein A9X01_13890 [Mycobacterium asiaticum]|uniref:DNA-binding protein n=1 Tax=Mycobacterium asiaticum TaxID=1790 RepID=A0A1A3CSB8_MYCAS|nr:hypothetical protein A9X01_13890 [Mycobacterium asiaticum]
MDPNPDDVANLNQEDAFQKLRAWGYPVTRRMIKYAILRRELIPVRLGNGNYLSANDLWRWIESRRQTGIYRLPDGAQR